MKCKKELREGVVSLLRRLADRIERHDDALTSKSSSVSDTDHPSTSDPIHVAADKMAVELIHQSLPPQLFDGKSIVDFMAFLIHLFMSTFTDTYILFYSVPFKVQCSLNV